MSSAGVSVHVSFSQGSVLLVSISFLSTKDRLPPHDQVSGGGMGSEVNENSSRTTLIWLPQSKECLFCLPVPTTIILSDGIDLVYMPLVG